MPADANSPLASASRDDERLLTAQRRISVAGAALGAGGLAFAALWLAFHGGGTTVERTAPVGAVLAAALLAIAIGGALVEAPSRRWPGWIAAAAALGIAGFSALSLLWTESPTLTVQSTALWACAVLVLVGAAAIFRGAGHAVAGVVAVIVVPTVIAFVVELHLLTDDAQLFAYNRLSYPLDYANGAAALVFIGTPAAVGVAALARVPLAARAALAGAAGLMISTGALAISRGGTLALVLSFAVMFVLARSRIPVLFMVLAQAAGFAAAYPLLFGAESGNLSHRRGIGVVIGTAVSAGAGLVAIALASPAVRAWSRPRIRALVAVVVVLVGAAAVAKVGPSIPDAVSEFRQSPTPNRGTIIDQQSRFNTTRSNRWGYWKVAVRTWRDHPFVGIGAGAFAISWYRERSSLESTTDPHGWPFKLASELGFVGLGFFLIFGSALVAAAVACRRRAGPDAVIGVAAAGSTAYFIAHAGVDWLFSMTAVVIVGMTAAGALLGAAAESPPRLGGLRLHTCAGFVAMLALAVLVPVWVSLNYEARAARQLDYGAASSSLDAARRWNPYSIVPLQIQALIDLDAGRRAEAAAVLRRALRAEPSRWEVWAELAEILSKDRKTAAAAAARARARALNPLDPSLAG